MKLWVSAFVLGLGLAFTAGCAHHRCAEPCKDGECPMKKTEAPAQAAQPEVKAAETPAPTPTPAPTATPQPAKAKTKAKKK